MIKRLRRRLTVILTAITGCILIAVLGISLWYSVEQTKLSSMERFSADAGYLTISLDNADGGTHNAEVLEAFGKEKAYIISLKIDGEPQTSNMAVSAKEQTIITRAEKAVADYSVSYHTTVTAAALPSLFSSIAYVNVAESNIFQADTGAAFVEETPLYNGKSGLLQEDSFAIGEAALATEDISVMLSYSSGGYDYPVFQYDGADYRVNSIEMQNAQVKPAVTYQLMIVEELTGETYRILLMYLGYIALMLCGIALLGVGNWFLTKLVVKPTEESLRRQTEFVAAASHELRSPLTTLRASLLAANIADTQEEAGKFRGCALQEADRMGRLISDLLILAGSDSKKWDIEKRAFDVDTLLIETNEQYASAAKEKKRRLKLSLPDAALGEYTGDRDRIRQILSVLLDNALEYSPEGSAVCLKAKRKNKKLQLSVIDEGAGISEKEKHRIFDRFYRTDKSRTDKAHFGLGLSVAKELAQLHGGSISVHDEPGGGTRFTLQL